MEALYRSPYEDAVERSLLLTLKSLTDASSGGFVAAPTSRPEKVGGIRNWDYRFCWLRDTTFACSIMLAYTTIFRWVQRHVPEFETRWDLYARSVGGHGPVMRPI